MLSIGEFARYLGVSVRMLRHYDSLGLLAPARVDEASGYRYYTAAQLERGNRLVALKDLGFPLAQIGPVLDAEVPTTELRAMLSLRRAEVAGQIEADRARLAEIERRLRMIEGDAMSQLEFVEKSLPAVRIAQITGFAPDQPQIADVIGPLFERLGGALGAAGVSMNGSAIAWYRPDEEGMHLAAAFPTTLAEAGARLAAAGVEVTDLDAAPRAVTVLHRGGMDGIGATWQALVTHIEEAGQQVAGLAREVYLHMPLDAEPATWVTELQQPIAD